MAPLETFSTMRLIEDIFWKKFGEKFRKFYVFWEWWELSPYSWKRPMVFRQRATSRKKLIWSKCHHHFWEKKPFYFFGTETFPGRNKCSIFSKIGFLIIAIRVKAVLESCGIPLSTFWRCQFDRNFHNGVLSRIHKTLFFLNFGQGVDLGLSRLVCFVVLFFKNIFDVFIVLELYNDFQCFKQKIQQPENFWSKAVSKEQYIISSNKKSI